ncbi:MAG: hypothetical protein GY765_38510, partial [bacterium]|nr:hypothetical protein [bacterium]
RRSPRHDFYEALLITEWYKRPNIAETIANDSEAPIRILTEIIPYLSKRTLQRLYESPDTHRGVRNNIIYYIESRGNEAEPPPEEEAGDS